MIDRYTTKDVGEIWTDQNKYEVWKQVEIVVCEVLSEKGMIPKKSLNNIKSKADFNSDNQYETHLGDGNVLSFPIGFGLKYKLNKRFIFNFNGNYNIINSDDIDLNNSLAGNDSYISIDLYLI